MNAGVKNANDVELSTSSSTRFCAWSTRAVTVTSTVRYGATLAVPNSGEVGLGVGVDAHEEVLSDVDVRDLGHLGQHGDLIGPPGGRAGDPRRRSAGPGRSRSRCHFPSPFPAAGGNAGHGERVAWGPTGITSSPDALPTLRTWGSWAMVCRSLGL